jgi:hypothetical protein
MMTLLIATSSEPQTAEKRKENMQEISEQRAIAEIHDVLTAGGGETPRRLSRGTLTEEGVVTLTSEGAERLRWYMQHLYPNRRARRAMKAWNRSLKKRRGALNDRRRVPPGAEVYFS